MLHKIDTTRETNLTKVNDELNCKCSITTAATVGSDSKHRHRHRSNNLYVIHSTLNNTYIKSLEWQHNIFFNDVKFSKEFIFSVNFSSMI